MERPVWGGGSDAKREIIAETADLAIGYRMRSRVNHVMQHLSLSGLPGRARGTHRTQRHRQEHPSQDPRGHCSHPSAEQIKTAGKGVFTSIGSSLLPRMVSFASTEPVAVRNIKVRDVVALGRFPFTNWIGTLTAEDEEAVSEALEATGLTMLAGRSIDNISDGERQRTLIARSLAQDTGLLVMDEPTAFLDLPSRFSIVSLLRQLTRET
ncbi:MAG: ABC transporter ATP-binding protein [Marinilabiliales bacterium]|nr:ABC transporter ATP-binding protein [Marinilabiliales bacterium]